MTIEHHLKSAERMAASPVASADATVVNGTIYMTVIPARTLVAGSTVAEQTAEVFAIIEERLARLGSDKRKIGHVTAWLAHVLDFPAFTEAWNAWVDPQHPPVRACAQVTMANAHIRIEMIVVASV